MNELTTEYIIGAAVLAVLARKAFIRLQLSSAKHPSLTGHSRMARRVAARVPFYEYADDQYFCADRAPAAIAEQRRVHERRRGARAACPAPGRAFHGRAGLEQAAAERRGVGVEPCELCWQAARLQR